MNLTSTLRRQVPSLASLSGLEIWHCHELWHRLAAAAPTRPLSLEIPYAAGATLEKKKKITAYIDYNWTTDHMVDEA